MLVLREGFSAESDWRHKHNGQILRIQSDLYEFSFINSRLGGDVEKFWEVDLRV